MPYRLLLLFFICFATASPSVAETVIWPRDWVSQHFRDHPLVGTMWRDSGTAAPSAEIKRDISAADFVLLGETHDNADHHLIQANLLALVTNAGKKPAVVFEMIPVSFQDRLRAYLSQGDARPEGLGRAVDWEERGWPDWSTYQPIADVAWKNKLPLLGGNIDRETTRAIGQRGLDAVDEALVADFSLSRPLQPALDTRLLAIMRMGHCNLLPEEFLPRMVVVQRAKDASMADVMIGNASANGGAVLIAGSTHVRKDWGVASLLKKKLPEKRVVSIAMLQVREGENEPKSYINGGRGQTSPFDYVLFTPVADISDHCAALRERFKPQ